MISCSLSPNTEADDVLLALKLLWSPWQWKRGGAIAAVEKRLGGVSFNSGRSALVAILKSMGIGREDEVICQGFTCVAVPDSIRFTGARPVFADIDNTYNMDPNDLEKKITPKTRAVIVQHTFGISADMERILALTTKYKLKVIEDFAHTMSLPLRGDAGFYSFGRDKVLSSVFGGLAIGIDVKKYHKQLEYPSMFWIFQQLLHPVAFSIILPLYRTGIGKVLLVVLQKLHLLSFPLDPSITPARYPNALAKLLLLQLKKFERYTKQRETITNFYGGKGSMLRYPVRVDNPKQVIRRVKKQGMLLGNWYWETFGDCPKTKEAARHIVNLPTRISLAQAKRVKAVL